MSITGHPGGKPTRVGMSIGDVGAGLYALGAVNAALLHRERTGEATKIDIAMLDCQIALLENAVVRYTTTGEVPGPLGARHPSITPFEAFPTADGHMIIAAGNDALFQRLCGALDMPGLASNPLFATNPLRNQHGDALRAELEPVLRRRPTAAWIEVIEAAGIPCGPINGIDQALKHPQIAARTMLVEAPDAAGETVKLAGNPLKFSAFPDPATRPGAPDLDADRARLLAELGL
jgi:CoA:oxalate CoA-transferase